MRWLKPGLNAPKLNLVWSKNAIALLHKQLRTHYDPQLTLISTTRWPILMINAGSCDRGDRGMDWKKLLGAITESVDEELRLRNAYLTVENRILRQQLPGRMQLCDSDRKALAAIGKQLGRKALAEVATIAQPDTLLAWYRTLVVQQCESVQPRNSAGRPPIAQEIA